MRILFATSIKTWGGGEEWMLASAHGLADRGHGVSLLAPSGSAILERARPDGLDVAQARFRSDADVASFLVTLHACRSRRIEAVVLNMDRVLRVAGVAARLAGVPVVLPRRGSEFPLKKGLLYRLTYRHVATGMLVNSRATERTLLRDIPWRPAGRLRVLPNGVDLARFDATRPTPETRDALGLAADTRVLIQVGELTARKNARLVLEVLPALRRDHGDVQLLVVGEGVERAALERQAEALDVADALHLLGFRRDVPDLLAASDVLVHPAFVEGFGYAVAEAMAAGLPVVASSASSLPELVDDGVTGLLAPPDEPAAWRDAIGRFLADPGHASAAGEAGRAKARREFSLERRLGELESILEEELERSGRPRPVTAPPKETNP